MSGHRDITNNALLHQPYGANRQTEGRDKMRENIKPMLRVTKEKYDKYHINLILQRFLPH